MYGLTKKTGILSFVNYMKKWRRGTIPKRELMKMSPTKEEKLVYFLLYSFQVESFCIFEGVNKIHMPKLYPHSGKVATSTRYINGRTAPLHL